MFGVTVYVPVYVQGVQGASAVSSGLGAAAVIAVLEPCQRGAGRSAGGADRALPLASDRRQAALVLAGFVLLSRIGVGSSRRRDRGAGPRRDRYRDGRDGAGVHGRCPERGALRSQIGVTTAALQFFRTIGGSLAVTGLGALLTAPARRGHRREPADRGRGPRQRGRALGAGRRDARRVRGAGPAGRRRVRARRSCCRRSGCARSAPARRRAGDQLELQERRARTSGDQRAPQRGVGASRGARPPHRPRRA